MNLRLVQSLAASAVVFAACLSVPTFVLAEQSGPENPDPQNCNAMDVRAEERPRSHGQATEVVIGVRLLDVTNIDDVDQSIDLDYIIRRSWSDPRLAPFAGCRFGTHQVWTPQVDLINSGRLWSRLRDFVEVLPGGQVTYLQRYQGAVVFPYKAHLFPFDEHQIVLSFLSLEYDDNEVILRNDTHFTGRTTNEFNVADWTLGPVQSKVQPVTIESASHSNLNVTLTAERRTDYFIWKIMVPLTFIVAMSWSVFWLDPARFGPQIGLSATSMLTLIAFQFATQAVVPRLNYLTIMDKFVLGSTVLVFLALVEALVTGYLISKEKEAVAIRMDWVCRWIIPAAFAVLILALFFEVQTSKSQ